MRFVLTSTVTLLAICHAPEAPLFHELLKAIELRGEHPTCRARFTGGWYRGTEDQGSVGVELDISLPPSLWQPVETFFPSDKPISLVGENAHQEHLADIIAGLCDGQTVAELRDLASPHEKRVAAFIQGVEVGHLSAASTKAYQGAVRELRTRGVPTTCVARVKPSPKGYQVELMLPEH